MKKLTLTPNEAAARLQSRGINIGYDKLRNAMIFDVEHNSRIIPFGHAFQTHDEKKGWNFIVYAKDLDDFITAHGGNEEEKS